MTKNEYADLFDQLYYGHEAEIALCGERFYLEQSDNRINVYKLGDTKNCLIAELYDPNKNSMIEHLFGFQFTDNKTLNNAYEDFDIITID